MSVRKTACEKGCCCLFGKEAQLVSKNDDCEIYRLADESGEAKFTVYSVFPGISLIYKDIHAFRFEPVLFKNQKLLEINHCREGRAEFSFEKKLCYLSPGDMSIIFEKESGREVSYPLKHYHGLCVVIDGKKSPRCLSCFLDDVNVQPEKLIEKFSSVEGGTIARSDLAIEHIFSELYNVPDEIKKGYFKVKVLELLLFLSTLEITPEETKKHLVSRSQAELAKDICEYLSERMNEKVTIEKLCEVFHVCSTSIKNSFKAVYGEAVYSYIRNQKMKSAAKMLLETDRSVLEIAGFFGYDNGSKFAKAFRNTMGRTPLDYRNSNK